MVVDLDAELEFTEFVGIAEPRLRRALVAAYGAQRGREAAAEALAWAWEHWVQVRGMHNPLGYLYRVGQSRSRPRRSRVLSAPPDWPDPWVEPELVEALASLSERQRISVVLVHGFGWTAHEVADITGIAPTTVQNHLERGLRRLRAALEVAEDV